MTELRRHVIDETVDITSALDTARRKWPELANQPTEMLRQLIVTGQHALDGVNRRLTAIRSTAGTLTASFPAGYLNALRDDWPD